MFVYYLVTKERYFHKPTYDNLGKSLGAMRVHMQKRGVKKLALPKIGCGLDGLKWDNVKDLLESSFTGYPGGLEIKIYYQ
mmetsp:Transcript_13362/g.20917  ORF Transcript_13362/g.20917 Transcript_13362/m.20917 type:complete len:80 (-) Transcript_13362:111-350(-)|eukprot:CAMPEP_0184312292 /NCGR_PEP_ID=MMETSP1049-20130417/48809_1 /TAXON_ID=77928 /ORGANISM="Proteomonas sulcata, Strain CCMP704" /LENGTH=79 /DNA_ID=CAMNT_0026628313 /DNA_START=147 /DNA_END=386 /DNA_ORIENTATION=+